MNTKELIKEIDQLKVDEKITLVEKIWDSIAKQNNVLPMHDWQKAELDKRYELFRQGELKTYDWQTVHNNLRTAGK
ncbi:MAG: addiction module protein [Calditrichaeota bacterium]|nr:MAG: addiction module protein [Calditrichota bacterium]MBL1204497.1 addiction module protein [Calditrichota bacterium]NOG44326.1 addiction module protein [Calditrichota bacterium]